MWSNVYYTNLFLLLSTDVWALDIQLSLVVHCGNSSHIHMRQRVNLCISNDPHQCPVQGQGLAPRSNSHIIGIFYCEQVILSTTQLCWHVLEQLVGALRFNPVGHVFDSRWSYWDYSFTNYFHPHYDLSTKQKSIRRVSLRVKKAGEKGLQTCYFHMPNV